MQPVAVHAAASTCGLPSGAGRFRMRLPLLRGTTPQPGPACVD
ncbi:hypothetical protein J2Y49_001894 [Azospirillum sp. BE72]|nr:hypothetical protein [Azospirillum sp. BE72]